MESVSTSDVIATISAVLGMLALAISYLTYRGSLRAASRPVLIFSMVSTFRWELRNVGSGPAINVLVADIRSDGETESTTNCYPVSPGAAIDLHWIQAGNELAARYKDIYGVEHNCVCRSNTNDIDERNLRIDWLPDTQQWIQNLRKRQKERTLSPRDLRRRTDWELDVLRNEPYARHGYIFKRADLAKHFAKESWYQEVTNDQVSIFANLTDSEKYQVYLVKEFQKLTSRNAALLLTKQEQ